MGLDNKNLPKASTIMMVRYIDNQPEVLMPEVLMVERNAKIEFAGGAYVFPGGRHDDADKTLCDDINDDIKTAKIAAIRECFEEVGYLLANDKNGALIGDKFANEINIRNNINNIPSEFAKFIKENEFTLLLDDLIPISIWHPPLYATKRYITWFFALEIKGNHNFVIDNQEIISYKWIRPAIALDEIKQGIIKALFPTKAHLSFLEKFYSISQLKEFVNCKKIPLVVTKTIDKGGNLWVEVEYKDYYPYHKEHIH